MDIASYVTALSAKGTMGAYISLGILCVVAGFLLSGIIFGIKRGIAKTTLRLITVLLSAVAAFALVSMATGYVEGLFTDRTLNELLTELIPGYQDQVPENWRNLIACFDAEVAERIVLFVVYLVAAPILFIALFYLIKLLSSLVYLLLAAILGMMGKRGSFISSLLGMLVGAAQGALIAAVILVPVSGFASLAAEVKEPLTSESVPAETAAQVEEFYGWWIDDVTDNPVLTLVGDLGGKSLFDKMTTATVGDEMVAMGDEAKTLVQISVDAIPLIGCDPTVPDTAAKDAMRSIVTRVGDSRYTAEIVSGLLRGAARAIDTEVLAVPLGEPFASLIKEVAAVLTDSNSQNLKADLETVLDIYIILAERGVLTSMTEGGDDIIDVLVAEHDGERVISLVTSCLNKNERMKPISDAMAKITLNALKGSITLEGAESEELFTNVKTNLNEILLKNREDYEDENEYKADVSATLDSTLKENGIEMDAELVDGMADYIVKNYGEKSEITDQDITDALLAYYDVYADWIASSGSEPEASESEEAPEQ